MLIVDGFNVTSQRFQWLSQQLRGPSDHKPFLSVSKFSGTFSSFSGAFLVSIFDFWTFSKTLSTFSGTFSGFLGFVQQLRRLSQSFHAFSPRFRFFSVFGNFLRVFGCNLSVQSRLRYVIRKLHTVSTVNDSSTLLVKKLVQGTLCRVKPGMQNRLVKELCVCDHVVCVCVKRVARARVCLV